MKFFINNFLQCKSNDWFLCELQHRTKTDYIRYLIVLDKYVTYSIKLLHQILFKAVFDFSRYVKFLPDGGKLLTGIINLDSRNYQVRFDGRVRVYVTKIYAGISVKIECIEQVPVQNQWNSGRGQRLALNR